MPPDPLRRSLALYKGLVEVTSLINGITDYAELLPAILDVAKRVVGAEASTLLLVDPETDDLKIAVSRGPATDLETSEFVVPRGHGIAGWVREHGRGLLVPDAYTDPRFYPEVDRRSGFVTRSILCVPLIRQGRTIGVLEVLNPTGRERFEETELEVLDAYAGLAATALDKLRALESRSQQERMERELELAAQLQRNFLPTALPGSRELEFASHYAPARHIGGDFYDVVQTGPDEYFAAVGDVSGKGVPAALCMAVALSQLRRAISAGNDPAAILRNLNAELCRGPSNGIFVTLLLARLQVSSGELRVANAGHPEPILATSNNAEPLRSQGGPPLGILDTWEAGSTRETLPPGARLCLHSDGLTESRDPEGCFLGREPVLETLAQPRCDAQDDLRALVELEENHRGDAARSDDLTLLCLRRR